MENNRKLRKLKLIAWYELIISILVILSYYIYAFVDLSRFLDSGHYGFNLLVGLLGVIGGVFLLNNLKSGFYLSLAWSFLQIISFRVGQSYVDLTQFLRLSVSLNLSPIIDFGLSINVVGIILLILLITCRREIIGSKNEKLSKTNKK